MKGVERVAKVMIVDDEPIMRKAVRMILEKHVPEVDRIVEAETGRAAVELAAGDCPDVVCMDIKMSGIDGTEATRIMKTMYPDIVVIVISAFEDFGTVQKFMKYGIHAYLLKPLDRMEFVEEIRSALDQAKQIRQRKRYEMSLQEHLNELYEVYENEIIYSFILGDHERLERMHFVSAVQDITMGGAAVVIRFHDMQQERYQNRVLYQKILEKLEKLFGKEQRLISALFQNELLVFLYNSGKRQDYEAWLSEQTEKISATVRKSRAGNISIGVGFYVESVLDMQSSWYGAQKAAMSPAGEEVRVCWYDGQTGQADCDYPVETEQKLFQLLEKEDPSAVKECFDEFFEELSAAAADRTFGCPGYYLKIFAYAVLRFRAEKKLDIIMGRELEQIDDPVLLYKWCRYVVLKTNEDIEELKKAEPHSLIEKAIQYIQDHYADSLSLADIAQELNISPFYFSRLFKLKTGKSYVEYLTDCRIEKAKYLLRSNRSMKINHIAEKVGYSDPKYFSKRFTGIVGMTPAAYRDKAE